MIKKEKGITLISLVIIIALMLIISSTTIHVSKERNEINQIKKMISDIEFLTEKISNYYLKYDTQPVIRDNNNSPINYNYTELNFDKKEFDNNNYYIIDLEALNAISLNYGKEGFYNPNASDDVYIINESSNEIYYVKGIEYDGMLNHSIESIFNEVEDQIPPTKPEIKVISGEINNEGIYTTNVEIEIIPGKSATSNINNTVYSINGGEERDINTLEKNILTIKNDGVYNVIAKTNGISENTLEIVIQIVKKAKDIIPENDYGKVVEYTPIIDMDRTAGNKAVENWKIFYADENNIYLISDNYIKYENCPQSKNNTALNQGDNDYKICFTNILKDYAGSADITNSRLQKLNNEYFFNREDNSTNVSTNNNMKVVAYMMDTNVWSTYKDENGKADYAIAGPTIEMLMKSYSQRYNVDYIARAIDELGYRISTDNGVTWMNYMQNTNQYLNTTDSLYAISSNQNAKGMWIASPSNNYNGNIMGINYNGRINSFGYADVNTGFRPLVCLKSGVELIKNDAGTGYKFK